MNARNRVLLPLALATSVAAAQEPQISVTQRVDVVVRTVTAEIVHESGRPLTGPPDPGQLEVREDGRRCEVVGVEPFRTAPGEAAAPPDAAPGPAPARPAGLRTRRQALYVDAGFLRVRSVKEVTQAFEERAAELVAIGPVEIVVADPQPRTFLPATGDAAALRAGLAQLARKVPGRDRVVGLRRDARQTADGIASIDAFRGRRRGLGSSPAGSGFARSAAREEAGIVRGGLSSLARWATSSPLAGEGILYLASDGFDVDLSEYYTAANADTLRTEVLPGILDDVRRAEQALLAGGWTTVPVALGSTGLGGFADAAEFAGRDHPLRADAGGSLTFADHPLDPLRGFAEATGGEVLVSADQLAPEVSRLASAWLVSFRVSRAPDGRLHRLEIRSREPGVRVRSVRAIPVGTPEAASTSRVLDLLAGETVAGGATLTFREPHDAGKGRRGAEMSVSVPLADITPLLARVGRGRMRVSLAVDVPGDVPFVTHAEVPLGKAPGAGWVYEAPMVWPKDAKTVAVVVEELATGTVATARALLAGVR